MKKIYLITMLTTVAGLLHGQPVPVETMIGHRYAMYQHTISKPLGADTRFGFVHIANVLGWYKKPSEKGGMENEFMNQGYVSYRLHNRFTVMLGYFYANIPNLGGSFAMQYHLKRDQWLMVISPRIDLKENGAYEMFAMFEHRLPISGNMKIYSRIQAMTSYGPFHHNRSYQRLRLGLDKKGFQMGFAFNMDEYGESLMVKANAGFFVRKELH
jgi:hypothetical protein